MQRVSDAAGRPLLAMIETAVGGFRRASALLVEARNAFDAMGYRIGLAQCDVVLGLMRCPPDDVVQLIERFTEQVAKT